MMADFNVVCVFLSLLLSSCLQPGCCQYQQIDLTSSSSGVSCSNSSVYTGSLDCNGALNGNNATTWKPASDPDANCFYTSSTGNNSWQVDLGQTRNIHRITIFPDTGYPDLMVDIAVYVGQTLVFTFPSDKNDIQNPTVITDNLPLRGSSINLNKTSYVVLCELQADECVSGRYGAQCQQTCSAGCQSDMSCDSITGNCTCNTGWSGAQCRMCADGYYGETCGNTCSAGCSNTCNKQDGTCNCRTGWSGDKCDACSDGYYKITATGSSDCRKCGNGCETTSCDDVTGSCTCRLGWQSPTCQDCVSGSYGAQCQQTCSAGCQSDTSCDSITGNCTCNAGWSGAQCRVCADGYYGETCGNACSAGCSITRNKQDGTCNCRTGRSGDKFDGIWSCDDVTGSCTCRPRWQLSACPECEAGWFGSDCQQTCSVGCNDTCEIDTGRCTCRQGWDTPTCTACASGYYNNTVSGVDTPEDCIPCGSGCSDTCDGQSGYCTCRTGWEPPFCDQECSAGHYSPSLGCKACGAGCEDVTSCDPLTGLCSCQRGWEPPTCHVCKTKLWGDNCTMTCGACAGDGSCDRITGACYFGLMSDDGGSNTGAVVGSVVGVGVVICITILVTGLLIRSRRLPQPTLEHSETPRNSAAEGHEAATECRADLEATNGEGIGEQGDVSHNYDTARSYENADDIRFYTSLQTNQPSTHGPQYANTTTATANYENLYVTTDNQYENIPNVKMM